MSTPNQAEQREGRDDDLRTIAVQQLREKMTAGELARNLAHRLTDEELAQAANGDLSCLNRQPDAANAEADRMVVPTETNDQPNRESIGAERELEEVR